MKLRFSDRLLTVLLAVLFLFTAAALVAESVFGAHVSGLIVKLFTADTVKWIVIRVLSVLLCLVIAWLCLRIAFRRHHRVDIDFVEQKTDGGDLRVSVKAIEGLVRKCVANHEEISLESVHLENHKEGLTVLMSCSTAADISIPLAVDALQKQLREYVMESTGVDIHTIQVEINDAMAELAGGAYRLHDAVIDPESRNQTAVTEAPEPAVQPAAEPSAPVEATVDQEAADEPAVEAEKLVEAIPDAAPLAETADDDIQTDAVEETEAEDEIPAETDAAETAPAAEETDVDVPEAGELNDPAEGDATDEDGNDATIDLADSADHTEERPPIVLPDPAPEFDEDPPHKGLFGKLFGKK